MDFVTDGVKRLSLSTVQGCGVPAAGVELQRVSPC